MKIICISNNTTKKENKADPVFFLKPDTSILTNHKLFFLPHFSKHISCGLSPVIKINRVGKNISEKFAHRYYDEIGIGLDITATDILEKCKNENLPWEAAKSFEDSAPTGLFISKTSDPGMEKKVFSLSVNDITVQQLSLEHLTYSVPYIISYISQFFTIKIGDLIFIAAPENLTPIKIHDKIQAFIGDTLGLELQIK